MSLEYFHVNDPRVFVFDLEFLGDVKFPNETRIYSIAVVHGASGHTFSKIVDPCVTQTQLQQFHTYQGCRRVTKKWLQKQKAIPLIKAFALLQRFVTLHIPEMPFPAAPGGYFPTQTPIFIAHACFRADLPVLKSALSRCGVAPLPCNWKFFDSLWYFRQVLDRRVMRGCETVGYSLHDIAQTLKIESVCGNMHDAMPDALLLHACLCKFGHLQGSLYSWWQTPLTTVPGIGLRSEMQLIQCNICSVEALMTMVAALNRRSIHLKHNTRGGVIRYLQYVGLECAEIVADYCLETVQMLSQ